MPNKDFSFKNLPIEAQDKSISKDDFKLVDSSNRIHEQKFQTRPTTFFKDSLKRFAKNKSSVVASIILGILLLMAVLVPILDTNPVRTKYSAKMTYLEPKLFEAGTGFWDGTKKWEKIPTYIPVDETTGEKDLNSDHWWPNPERFVRSAVTNKRFTDFIYTSGESKYGFGGYIEFGYNYKTKENESIYYKTLPISEEITMSDVISLKTFDTYDDEKIKIAENNKAGAEFPSNFEPGKLGLYFEYEVYDETEDKYVTKELELLEPQEVYNIGSAITAKATPSVNLTEKIKEKLIEGGMTIDEANGTTFNNALFEVKIENVGERVNTCGLIKAIEFDVTPSDPENTGLKEMIEMANFTDATENILRPYKIEDNAYNHAYWETNGVNNIHLSQIVYCSFDYDSYKGVFGTQDWYNFELVDLRTYERKGWIENTVVVNQIHESDIDPLGDPDKFLYSEIEEGTGITIVKGFEDVCPIKEIISVTCDPTSESDDYFVNCKVCYYQYYGYDTMPKFLMGTDKDGKNMFRYTFEGLRTSLVLGIFTFLVCFVFGLIWGSVSGYFGGTVDLVMERFTDILSGVPWVVVMTLVIIKLQSSIWTFALALCLTGWIGTAATTRTQFYRFRGREYVLASRTLGANDARLISKHILPNAMGTIITSAVLMIPSVIFSEATISYLGLGLTEKENQVGILKFFQYSLGVILSKNQSELTSNPYLLIFPSVIIALLMISFNLFGNGLRDAVNPSLKGED